MGRKYIEALSSTFIPMYSPNNRNHPNFSYKTLEHVLPGFLPKQTQENQITYDNQQGYEGQHQNNHGNYQRNQWYKSNNFYQNPYNPQNAQQDSFMSRQQVSSRPNKKTHLVVPSSLGEGLQQNQFQEHVQMKPRSSSNMLRMKLQKNEPHTEKEVDTQEPPTRNKEAHFPQRLAKNRNKGEFIKFAAMIHKLSVTLCNSTTSGGNH